MQWMGVSGRKQVLGIGAWIVGVMVGAAIMPLSDFCSGRAAEPKAPESNSPSDADLPDVPSPAPHGKAGTPPAPAKDPTPTPSPESKQGEKTSAKSPAEPKSTPDSQPSAFPKSQSNTAAESATKPTAEPSPKPTTQPPLPPEEGLPAKQKVGPPPKPNSQTSPKEKTTEPLLEWPLNEAHRKNRAEVINLLRTSSLNAEQIKFLTEYYSQYGLARWTQVANRAEVRKYREELFRELAQAEGQAHDQAVQIVLPLLIKMAEGNHHPAARLNAVLAIGELNRLESKGSKPPEPLPAAQPILLQLLQNPQTPQALRVAALVGLRRHAELGALADPTKTQSATILLGILQERSPSSRSAPGLAWLQQLAIEMLEVLKTPGPNGQVARALSDVLANTNNPMSIRIVAARTIGNLDYSQGFPGDLNNLLREMGQLALDALNAELDSYQKEKKLLPRRLQTYLIGVYHGLNGLQKIATQPKETAALHQKIFEAVRSCAALFDSPKLRDASGKLLEDDLVMQLAHQKTLLNEAIAAPAAPARPPTEKSKTSSGE